MNSKWLSTNDLRIIDINKLNTYKNIKPRKNPIHYNFVDASLSEEPKIRKLLTGVNDISFEFYYSKKWNQTYEGNDLPSAISIELDTQEFGLIKRKFLLTGIESASALTN